MKLTGQKVYLDFPVLEDAPLLLKWENDPVVWESGDNKMPYSREDMELFIAAGQNIEINLQARWMIRSKTDNLSIGCVDLYEYDKNNRRAGIGILIYSESNRKKGYARESLELIINYAKTQLHLHQLFCYILEDNRASLSLFTGCGFVKTGEKKQWRLKDNEWKNEFIFQLFLEQ